jgi:hypothetical protein
MAQPGSANSRRARRFGDFPYWRQQHDLKMSKSRRLMVTGSNDGDRRVVRATNGRCELVTSVYDISAQRNAC